MFSNHNSFDNFKSNFAYQNDRIILIYLYICIEPKLTDYESNLRIGNYSTPIGTWKSH